MTIEKIYRLSVNLLIRRKLPDPELDARAIIAHHTGIDRNAVFLHKTETLSPFLVLHIFISVLKRSMYLPIAYILGYKYFFQDKLLVSRKSLIPRADTEHLLYAVQDKMKPVENCKIIDIGTGTGAIAISLARIFPEARIQAIDIDISTAEKNIKNLGINNIDLIRLDFLKFKAAQPVNRILFDRFDLIISNPPYLSKKDLKNAGKDARLYEPGKAFYGGIDGLNFYRKIAEFSKERLNPGGLIVLEVDYKWEKVKEIFTSHGYINFIMGRDYNGLERTLLIN